MQVPVPRSKDFAELDELTLLACLVAGEARGEPYRGQIAVAWVARNRVEAQQPKWFGAGWHGVVLKKWQFSCFLASDPNSAKLALPVAHFGAEVWAGCYKAAAAVYFALAPDPTGSADHYYATSIDAPTWVDGHDPRCEIGAHKFYRLRA